MQMQLNRSKKVLLSQEKSKNCQEILQKIKRMGELKRRRQKWEKHCPIPEKLKQ